jgi:hypothetical protein
VRAGFVQLLLSDTSPRQACCCLFPGPSAAGHSTHLPRPTLPLFRRESEVRNVPLMGDREPLDALAAEYAAGSAIYRQKIDRLKQDYGSIRWGGGFGGGAGWRAWVG